MKNFKFLIILLFLSVNSFAQKSGDGKTDWSPWIKTCFANLYVSIKCNGYTPDIPDGKNWAWNIRFKNTGNQNSHFSVDSWFLQTNERFNWGRWDVKANSESTHTTLYYKTPPPAQNKNISDFWGFKITRYIENPTDDWTIKSYACNGIYAVCDYNCNESNSQANSNNSSSTNQNTQNSSNTSQNSTGSSGTSSMNRGGNVVTGNSNNTNSEGTGWNGNNGSSNNNNYNQQIQNQNTKTTEAFDLYNSTGNYEEARRKLVEAKNNAPDEVSRQVAQQNLDKLDKVEKRNQNVETISKTIDFTTDLIKTMREEKKKAMFAEIEQIEKERMEKFEFYSNKLLVQLEKINVLEKNTKKTFDDYKILLNEFGELKKTYNELYYSVSMNDRDEYKKNQDYFKMKEEECQVRYNQALINMYKDGFFLEHNEIGNNINFSDYDLIKNIIEKLIINVDKGNGKSAYEIAYISNKTIDYLIGNYDYYNRTKPVNIDVINNLLNYLLENEYKYLEIANKNNISEAKFVKSYYLVTGWYKINQDINLARSNFKNLLDSKIIKVVSH